MKTGHLKQLSLIPVQYGQRIFGDFVKKHATATLTLMRLHFEHVKSDHSKQLRPCLSVIQKPSVVQNFLKSYWGEMDRY